MVFAWMIHVLLARSNVYSYNAVPVTDEVLAHQKSTPRYAIISRGDRRVNPDEIEQYLTELGAELKPGLQIHAEQIQQSLDKLF